MAFEELKASVFDKSSLILFDVDNIITSITKEHGFGEYLQPTYYDRKHRNIDRNQLCTNPETMVCWLLGRACENYIETNTVTYDVRRYVRDALAIYFAVKSLAINKLEIFLTFQWLVGGMGAELKHIFKYYRREWTQICFENPVDERRLKKMFKKLKHTLDKNNALLGTPVYRYGEEHSFHIWA